MSLGLLDFSRFCGTAIKLVKEQEQETGIVHRYEYGTRQEIILDIWYSLGMAKE
jgi:hypothetical protein